MTVLSPDVQFVLDAATAPTGDFCLENINEIAAAAICAAVDQVVPISIPLDRAAKISPYHIRSHFLAIAAELNGITTPTES